jgi:hypothetical protein
MQPIHSIKHNQTGSVKLQTYRMHFILEIQKIYVIQVSQIRMNEYTDRWCQTELAAQVYGANAQRLAPHFNAKWFEDHLKGA